MGFGAGALGTKLFPLLLTMQLSPFLLMRILVFFDNALWLCVDEVEATVGASSEMQLLDELFFLQNDTF